MRIRINTQELVLRQRANNWRDFFFFSWIGTLRLSTQIDKRKGAFVTSVASTSSLVHQV